MQQQPGSLEAHIFPPQPTHFFFKKNPQNVLNENVTILKKGHLTQHNSALQPEMLINPNIYHIMFIMLSPFLLRYEKR